MSVVVMVTLEHIVKPKETQHSRRTFWSEDEADGGGMGVRVGTAPASLC